MEMPPLPLMVLDGLEDDIETVETLRDCGETALRGLALVAERDILAATRALLTDGLVTVQHTELKVPIDSESVSTLDDASLRACWFGMTPAGRRVWSEASDVLDTYWQAHPPDS